jgi:hypothetical protein
LMVGFVRIPLGVNESTLFVPEFTT